MHVFFQPTLPSGSLLTYKCSNVNAKNKNELLINQIRKKEIPFNTEIPLEIQNIKSAVTALQPFVAKVNLQGFTGNLNTYTIADLRVFTDFEKDPCPTDSEVLIALFLLKISGIYEDNVWKFNETQFVFPKKDFVKRSRTCSIL